MNELDVVMAQFLSGILTYGERATRHRQAWEALTDEQRAEITAKREKDSAQFRARRQAEHEADVAKLQSKAAKKSSGMTGKAYRRAERKAKRSSAQTTN